MEDKRIRVVLRNMAWNRAKGELMSILSTFWDEAKEYENTEKAIYKFIEKMENEVIG